MNRKFLIIGRSGQLAHELRRSLAPLAEIETANLPEFDLTDSDRIRVVLDAAAPDLVLNAAAYTDVDKAENDRDRAFAVNADGPGSLARACAARKIAFVHFSTDYVFDGLKHEPYTETDPPGPLNLYGLSKLRGEENVLSECDGALVFRLAWLFSARGNNFVHKVRSWAAKNAVIRVVDDQFGNPSWARIIAASVAVILAGSNNASKTDLFEWTRSVHGLYHLASSGSASRFDWAAEILRHTPVAQERQVRLERAKTIDFACAASRPTYSVLDCGKAERTFGVCVSDWRRHVSLALEEG